MNDATDRADSTSQEPEQPPPTSAMQAVSRRFMRYLGEEGSGLNGIWGIIAAFNLGVVGVSAAIQYHLGFMPYDFEIWQDPAALQAIARRAEEVNLLSLLNYPLILISVSLYYAGFAAMRTLERDSAETPGFHEMREAMFGQFGSTAIGTLVYLLSVVIGAFCCVLPGFIAAFLLLPVPYISSKPGYGASLAMSESIGWLKRHTGLFLLAAVTSVVVGVSLGAIQFLGMTVLVARFGDVGILIANAAVWFVGVIVGYFAWMFLGSIFVTIDLAEERIRR